MPRTTKTSSKDLVESSHEVVTELAAIRAEFKSGKIGLEAAQVHIGLFNASAKSILTALSAEKWKHKLETEE